MSGTSVLPYRYRINGVLSTDKTVMQNMEMICGACQSWLTYDINQGKWAVVINEPGTSTVSFDDSNIIGPVSVQGTGLRELYNTVRVEFPHVDLADEPDYIENTIPEVDRNANEPDNTLTINLDLINDPVMAESLGMIELKQSRVNRVIKFTTDYTHLGVKAGDLIDVTNSVLGYTNKMFRVVSMAEQDAEDGGINITITALEYDANVYNLDDIFRYERSNQNGLVTIGYVGAPTTPTITAFANSSRPRTTIATTVPTGIVDGIEFWFSSDGTNYALLSTETPTGGAFTFGQTVTYDYDKYVVTSNVYAKCRAINATTTSDYSNVGSLLNFAPVQITDAIGNNTSILDSAGVPIATLLGLNALLKGLDTYMNGNSNLANAVGGQISSSSATVPITASFEVDPLNNTGNGVPPWTGGTNPYVTTQNLSFTVPATGTYVISMDGNFGNTSANTSNTEKRIDIAVVAGSTHGTGNVLVNNGTSSTSNMFDDLYTQIIANLTVNTAYHLEMSYGANAGDFGRFTGQVTSAGNNIWKNY